MVIITLLSDFGTRDGFAAAMKGVMLEIAPDARLVDASHEVMAGDVYAGAWALAQYWRLFPAGTVHLAVVDPGVGGPRKAIAVEADSRYVVAPDNGLVTRVIRSAADWRAVEVTQPAYARSTVSATFHGRDVFAPAAAHLAAGVRLDRLGPVAAAIEMLDIEDPARVAGGVAGSVAHVDRFGNLITDIPGDWIEAEWQVRLEEETIGRLRRTYSDVSEGEAVAVIGSRGTLEIAIRGGSAAEGLGASRGARVRVGRPAGGSGPSG